MTDSAAPFVPPPAPPAAPNRPTRLTVLLVLLWVLEGFVVLFAAYAWVMIVAQLALGPLNTLPAGHPAAPYLEQIFWAQMPYAQVPLQTAQGLLSIALLVLGVMAFRGVAAQRERLRTLLLAGAVFAVFKFAFAAYSQLLMSAIMPDYMQALMSAGPQTMPPELEAFMRQFMSFAIVGGIAVMFIVLALKLALYVLLRRALVAPDASAFFAAQRASARS